MCVVIVFMCVVIVFMCVVIVFMCVVIVFMCVVIVFMCVVFVYMLLCLCCYNFLTDALAVFPLQTHYVVREGAAVSLGVDTVAFTDEGSEVIQWSLAGQVRGYGQSLTINSSRVEDSGLYTVNYTKMEGGTYQTTTTSISLTVQGMLVHTCDIM